MNTINLYHGSASIIEKPEFGKGKKDNDYGLGFYCTEHIELAQEWACDEGVNGYANHYEIDATNLSVLNLSSDEYTVLNWLALLMKNRKVKLTAPIEKRGAEYLVNNFLPDYENYDIIIGYRADDSYFSFARSFVANTISLSQLAYAMKLGKLGEQYVLKTKKAFDALRFVDYTEADNSVYYAKRKSRDDEARAAFFKEQEKDDINGVFMRDILREEMKNGDSRLQ